MSVFIDDEFREIESKTRARLLESIEKAGFAEGAYQGSQLSFQTGFDKGYKDGLKYGREIGAKAVSIAENADDKDVKTFKKMLHCKICNEKK